MNFEFIFKLLLSIIDFKCDRLCFNEIFEPIMEMCTNLSSPRCPILSRCGEIFISVQGNDLIDINLGYIWTVNLPALK